MQALDVAAGVLYKAKMSGIGAPTFVGQDTASDFNTVKGLLKKADPDLYDELITGSGGFIEQTHTVGGKHQGMINDIGDARVSTQQAELDFYRGELEAGLENFNRLDIAQTSDERLTGKIGFGKTKGLWNKLPAWIKAPAMALAPGKLTTGLFALDWAEGTQTNLGMVLGALQADDDYVHLFPDGTTDVLKMNKDEQVSLLNEMARFDNDGNLVAALRDKRGEAMQAGED